MTFQSELLSAIQKPYPSKSLMELPIFYEIPELEACIGVTQNPLHHKYAVFTHIMKVVDNIVTKDPVLRLAGLLHDIAKPQTRHEHDGMIHFHNHEDVGAEIAKEILTRLGFDSFTRDNVADLVKHHMVDFRLKDPEGIKTLYMTLGEKFIDDLMKLHLADEMASGYCNSATIKIMAFQKNLIKINEDVQKAHQRNLTIEKGMKNFTKLGGIENG